MGKNLVRKILEVDTTLTIPAGVKSIDLFIYQSPRMLLAGGDGSLIQVQNKDLYAWGYNSGGEVGDNSTTPRSSPVLVSGSHKPRGVYGGGYAVIRGLINEDGNAYMWGGNSGGSIGDGTTTSRSTPVLVSGSKKWKTLAVGADFTIGLDSAGIAWAWGSNLSAELGINVAASGKSTPTLVAGSPRTYKKIACGTYHTLALSSEGSLYGWGYNQDGNLGPTSGNYSSPFLITVAAGKRIKDIAAGEHTSFLLTEDGDLYAWGRNTEGQCGTSSATFTYSSPTLVAGGYKWEQISATASWAMGLTTSGDAYSWGEELDGRLGQNTGVNVSSPTAVVGGNKFVRIGAGFFNGNGLKKDGTLMSWGRNTFGQVGDNTTTDRSSPVAVAGSRVLNAAKQVLINKATVSVSPGSPYNLTYSGAMAVFDSTVLGAIPGDCYVVAEYKA